MKSDGDRLHVRLGKDQRIKEIALEMLKVSPLPAERGADREALEARAQALSSSANARDVLADAELGGGFACAHFTIAIATGLPDTGRSRCS